MLSNKEQPILNVIYPWQQEYIYIKVLPTMIAEDCISILVLYYLLLEYGIFGNYSWHSMWDFIKDNMIFIYN